MLLLQNGVNMKYNRIQVNMRNLNWVYYVGRIFMTTFCFKIKLHMTLNFDLRSSPESKRLVSVLPDGS